MAYLEKYTPAFRAGFAILAALLFYLTGSGAYYQALTPDDQNLFRTTPGTIMVVSTFPAEIIPEAGMPADELALLREAGGIAEGDILISINDERFRNAIKLEDFLESEAADEQLTISVYKTRLDQEFVYSVKRSSIPLGAFRKIPTSVYVFNVVAEGASDRAGLKVGDLIYSINGERFKDAADADLILKRAQANREIAYDIMRATQSLTLQITLATVGIHLPVLIMLISGLVMMLTGTFIGLTRPQFRAARLLGLTFLATGFFMTYIYVTRFLRDEFSEWRFLVLVLSIFMSMPLWLHLAHYFPLKHEAMLARKWIRYTGYGLAVLFIGICLFVNKNLFDVSLLILILYSSIVQFVHRKKSSREYQDIARILKRAGILTFSGVFVTIGLVIWFTYKSPGQSPFYVGYIGLPLLITPLSYLYVIGQYRLLNLDIRVRRNVQYSLATAVWFSGCLVLLFWLLYQLPGIPLNLPNIVFEGTFIEIQNNPMDAAKRVVMEKGALMLLALVLGYALIRIRAAGQKYIDQKFFRGQYDYRRAASELAEVMSNQLNMNNLAQGIVSRLASLMKLKQAAILLYREPVKSCCSEVYGLEAGDWEAFASGLDQEFLEILHRNSHEESLSVEYLPGAMRQEFVERGFRHIVGINSKDKLVGVLLVGEKLSESSYRKEDLSFLSSAAKQASVAIENAFLYDRLALQERLKHELEIARRIQLASLPQRTPSVAGLDISGISVPALEVGGDYFDYLNGAAHGITIIVGDVSGKGTSAALYMSKVQGIMRSLHDFGLSPRELFVRANQLLIRDLEKQSFITALGASFDARQRKLCLARAGHAPLYHYQIKSGVMSELTPRGIGLGLTDNGIFARELEERTISYEAGDIFLFITDGITEAQSEGGQEYGAAPLAALLEAYGNASASAIRDSIVDSVNQFAGAVPQHDDLTIVVVKAV